MKAEVPWLNTANIIFFQGGGISIAASSSTDSLAETAFLLVSFCIVFSSLQACPHDLAEGVSAVKLWETHTSSKATGGLVTKPPPLTHINRKLPYLPRWKATDVTACEQRVQKGGGGPDPAFPLLFHENPAFHTFFITLQNPVFLSQKNTLKGLISTTTAKACVWRVHVKLLMPETSKTKTTA